MKTNRTLFFVVSILILGSTMTAQAPQAQQQAGPQFPANGNLPSVWIEDLTWTEVRDALAGGVNVVIVAAGGTEQNGPHMVMGKHNYIVGKGAEMMAKRLGNALVAPVLQYVPEGNYNSANFGNRPGVISNPSPTYNKVLEAAARSYRQHGFKDIIFIGDSGGNQAAFGEVAGRLNQEWEGTDAKVFPVTAYYEKGAEHYRAYMLAAFGYDDATVGGHAGISDTSQLLFVNPSGIRKEKIEPLGGSRDSGVSGDPTKASADIGRMGMEFKVNAAIGQYRELKRPPRGGRGGQ